MIPSFDPDGALNTVFTELDTALVTNVPIILVFVGALIAIGVGIALIKRFVPGA